MRTESHLLSFSSTGKDDVDVTKHLTIKTSREGDRKLWQRSSEDRAQSPLRGKDVYAVSLVSTLKAKEVHENS